VYEKVIDSVSDWVTEWGR